MRRVGAGGPGARRRRLGRTVGVTPKCRCKVPVAIRLVSDVKVSQELLFFGKIYDKNKERLMS